MKIKPEGRLHGTIRIFNLLEIIKRGPVTQADLAHQFKCHTKTIRRDITAMIEAGLPIQKDGPYITSKENSMSEMYYCDNCKDYREGRSTGGCRRHHHTLRLVPEGNATLKPKSLKAKPNGVLSAMAQSFTRAELFSVIKGEVHLRGCEFNGGFLVLNGDTLQSYPTLSAALEDAAMQPKMILDRELDVITERKSEHTS